MKFVQCLFTIVVLTTFCTCNVSASRNVTLVHLRSQKKSFAVNGHEVKLKKQAQTDSRIGYYDTSPAQCPAGQVLIQIPNIVNTDSILQLANRQNYRPAYATSIASSPSTSVCIYAFKLAKKYQLCQLQQGCCAQPGENRTSLSSGCRVKPDNSTLKLLEGNVPDITCRLRAVDAAGTVPTGVTIDKTTCVISVATGTALGDDNELDVIVIATLATTPAQAAWSRVTISQTTDQCCVQKPAPKTVMLTKPSELIVSDLIANLSAMNEVLLDVSGTNNPITGFTLYDLFTTPCNQPLTLVNITLFPDSTMDNVCRYLSTPSAANNFQMLIPASVAENDSLLTRLMQLLTTPTGGTLMCPFGVTVRSCNGVLSSANFTYKFPVSFVPPALPLQPKFTLPFYSCAVHTPCCAGVKGTPRQNDQVTSDSCFLPINPASINAGDSFTCTISPGPLGTPVPPGIVVEPANPALIPNACFISAFPDPSVMAAVVTVTATSTNNAALTTSATLVISQTMDICCVTAPGQKSSKLAIPYETLDILVENIGMNSDRDAGEVNTPLLHLVDVSGTDHPQPGFGLYDLFTSPCDGKLRNAMITLPRSTAVGNLCTYLTVDRNRLVLVPDRDHPGRMPIRLEDYESFNVENTGGEIDCIFTVSVTSCAGESVTSTFTLALTVSRIHPVPVFEIGTSA